MSTVETILIYTLADQSYGVPVSAIQRVAFAAEVTPLPDAPATIVGLLNVQGEVMPVVSMRTKCHVLARPMLLTDRLVIVTVRQRSLALLVDGVREIVEIAQDDITAPADLLSGPQTVEGVLKCADGLVLIHHLEHFFAAECAETIPHDADTGQVPHHE